MRRGLYLLAGILVLGVGLGLAQQVLVQSPNGNEVWKKGEFRQIKFTCDQTAGTFSVVLVRVASGIPSGTRDRTGYQELGQIWTAKLSPNVSVYSFNWEVGRLPNGTAAPGSGYKILVKVTTPSTSLSDVGDAPFSISSPPTIDMFAVNDGLAVTEQKRVTLNYRFSGFPIPSRYRVRCKALQGTSDILGAWLPLPTTSFPVYDLPDTAGDYSLGLILANDLGESPTVADTIRYAPVVPQKDYTINAATLVCGGFPDMNPAWSSCRCTYYSASITKPTAADCSCTSTGVVVVKTTGVALGTKVEYEFFGGRALNPGWSFVSRSYSDVACQDYAGSAILIMPQPGSQNILFKVRLWTEPFTAAFKIPVCEFRINSLVIRGPADRPVSEAFK